MSKGWLIFSVLFTAFILLIVAFGKDSLYLKSKEDDQTKRNENETSTTEYLPPLRKTLK